LKEYAQQVGLDGVQFDKDMASPEVQKHIQEEMSLGQQSDVSGTPTLFLNGKRVMNRSFEGIKQMVDEALKPKG
jgi:protein-disulfide isomerase